MPHPLAIAAAAALALTSTSTTWHSVPPTQHNEGNLGSVSCTGGTCMAIGTYADPAVSGLIGQSQQFRAGTWHQVALPSGGQPEAVSCSSASACMAVGYNGDDDGVSWRWNGAAWTLIAMPPAADGDNTGFTDVSCASASRCIAVGFTYGDDAPQPTSYVWNGSAWSELAVPTDPSGALLNGVSCPNATSCVAVGWTAPSDSPQLPYVARLSNGRWVRVAPPAVPQPSRYGLELDGISCSTSTHCDVAGTLINLTGPAGGAVGGGYLASWNGRTWSRHAVPAPAGQHVDDLVSISCSSAVVCRAIGDTETADSTTRLPLAIGTTDGRTWAVQSQPALPANGSRDLADVSCTASLCLAVGGQYDPTNPSSTEFAMRSSASVPAA